EPADRRRADERAALDLHARLDRGFDRSLHVERMRTDGLVRPQLLQLRRFPRELDDLRACAWRRSGQTDVRAVDAELIHQLQEALLHRERRVPHRRALQPVAQRFVVQLDGAVIGFRRAAVAVPVVDEVVDLAHRSSFGAGSGASANPTRAPTLHRRYTRSTVSKPAWRAAVNA